jgi:hypothetical protein
LTCLAPPVAPRRRGVFSFASAIAGQQQQPQQQLQQQLEGILCFGCFHRKLSDTDQGFFMETEKM